MTRNVPCLASARSLTITEAARILRVSKQTVYRLVRGRPRGDPGRPVLPLISSYSASWAFITLSGMVTHTWMAANEGTPSIRSRRVPNIVQLKCM